MLTLTSYDHWRQSHAPHHASSGNLDRRGIGDITILTVKEFLALDQWARLKYRLYRNPMVMFGFGPAYLFVFRNRFPNGRTDLSGWLSTMTTNIAIALLASLMITWLGWSHFLAVHGPITLIAASVGVWLFYVQHQFEDTLWVDTTDWSPETAALQGSSYYLLPLYRLPDVLRHWPELKEVTPLTLRDSLRSSPPRPWSPERPKKDAPPAMPPGGGMGGMGGMDYRDLLPANG